jgi:CheY-like chemotaxis protein
VLYVDPPRAKQIIWNLLKNAIRYTPSPGRVQVYCAGVYKDRLRIEVKDTGMGMDSKLIARAFEPFEQGLPATATATDKHAGGLGLGLAIVQSWVDAHGGRVWAQSPGPGQGSTFSVELPLASDNIIMESTLVDIERPAFKKQRDAIIRVLLVEDDDESAEALVFALEARGMKVTACSTGGEALSRADAQEFDVVISDIGLPDMSGYEFFAVLRTRHPKLAGIAYSGYGQKSDVQRCLEVGFSTHLSKPVRPSKLVRAIRRSLSELVEA